MFSVEMSLEKKNKNKKTHHLCGQFWHYQWCVELPGCASRKDKITRSGWKVSFSCHPSFGSFCFASFRLLIWGDCTVIMRPQWILPWWGDTRIMMAGFSWWHGTLDVLIPESFPNAGILTIICGGGGVFMLSHKNERKKEKEKKAATK